MVYDRCHQMVTQIVPDSPRDIFPLLNYMTQDIISGFFFGDKNGSRCLQGEDTDFLGAWHIHRPTFHWFAELPAVANMIYGSKFGDYLPTWRKALEGEKKISEIYDKWMGRLDPRDSYRRLWIWQEIRLTRKAAVLCGYAKIVWNDFRDTIFRLIYKPKRVWVMDNISDPL